MMFSWLVGCCFLRDIKTGKIFKPNNIYIYIYIYREREREMVDFGESDDDKYKRKSQTFTTR